METAIDAPNPGAAHLDAPNPGAAHPDALQVSNLSKSFGGAQALRGVDVDIAAAEIHGLLGQNGSGKSTFVKLLAGVYAPDPGALVRIAGSPVSMPMSAAGHEKHGLAFVHQNLGLIPSLTVLENLRIRSLTRAGRRIDWSAERRAAAAAFERLSLSIDPSARIDSLSAVDRALVAITRAFEQMQAPHAARRVAGLLLLDEPTPFLPREDVKRLFDLMRRIVSHGASVLFISHDVDEVREITHRATILRDGAVAGRFVTAEVDREDVIESIVGRRITRFKSGRRDPAGAPLVSAEQLCGPLLHDVGIALRPGEIVGLTGLVGAGHDHVLHHLFGARPGGSGRLRFGPPGTLDDGLDLAKLTPRLAMRQGIAFLPGDRQSASGIGSLEVVDNLFLPDVAAFFRRGVLRRREMAAAAGLIGAEFEVRPPGAGRRLSSLSGGNAQKVLLAKWLKLRPRLLLLEEPTQGVDVGARQQLLRAIRGAADAGTAVRCASCDHEQLADLCDRVLIFAGGAVARSLSGADLSRENIGAGCYAGR